MTEMLNVPFELPPFMRPYASAMLYGLWGWLTRPLQVIIKAGIPDILGDEPQSAAALAAATGCNADALDRFLRALAGCDIFERLPDGTYQHTPISRCLRSDAPMSAAPSAQLQATPIYQAALSNLEHTLRTGRPAIEAVAPDGFFSYLRTHPEEATIFDHAMSSMAAANEQIVGAYDFSQSRVIADVGGGQGTLVRAILERTPNVQAILFDLADVVAGAAPAARLQILAGDFLKDSLPSADLHILKLILHDWPDAAVVKILSAVRRAARVGGKLLVIESLMSEDAGRFHASHLMDVSMLAVVGGRERTTQQFQQVFTDTGFRLLRVIPTASPIAQIVEAEAV